MHHSAILRALGIAILAAAMLNITVADEPPKGVVMAKWDVELPTPQKDKEDQLHNKKEIPIKYIIRPENGTVVLDAVTMKARFYVGKDEQGKQAIQGESTVCFMAAAKIEQNVKITVNMNGKDPIIFNAIQDQWKPSIQVTNKYEACFPAGELTLPSFWQSIEVECSK